jgi:hypothetical protein
MGSYIDRENEKVVFHLQIQLIGTLSSSSPIWAGWAQPRTPCLIANQDLIRERARLKSNGRANKQQLRDGGFVAAGKEQPRTELRAGS